MITWYTTLVVVILGLCWGSFLNVVGYRLLHQKSLLTPRSFCPHCNVIIAWYDNIPLLSWLLLRGHCRRCRNPISPLYPLIELLTALLTLALWNLLDQDFALYSTLQNFQSAHNAHSNIIHFLYMKYILLSIFFSALIVATRTDAEAMLIPQLCTVWLIPLGLYGAYAGILDISLFESCAAIIFGYGILWITGKLFYCIKKVEGIGVGDLELLAVIGSFTGIFGVWISLFIGSLVGSGTALVYCMITRQSYMIRIPFGPFLALGAVIGVLFRTQLLVFLL